MDTEEKKYKVLINNEVVAKDMDIRIATVLVRALFEEYYNDKGSIKIASSTLHCWKRKGHGLQTYLQVV
jgi:hypothetical protein